MLFVSADKMADDAPTSEQAASDDFFSKRFSSMPCWKNPVKTTVADRPWIKPESLLKHSYVMKYINYETEPGFIDLDNPLAVREYNEFRLEEKKRLRKKKKSESFDVDKDPTSKLEKGMCLRFEVNLYQHMTTCFSFSWRQ
jgi:hypothetical protein